MLDLSWERYVPLLEMKNNEIETILAEYDKTLRVSEFRAIQLGCKNSNFAVHTNKGTVLLRITNPTDLNNEAIAYDLMKNRINIPSLLFHTQREKMNVFVYQYIEGVSLQKHMIKSGQCDAALLKQVARAAAIIHNTPKEKTATLAKWDVPPYALWYDAFLDHPMVRKRLGEALRERILRLVLEKQELIPEIDRVQSLIHCDFRPANMLVDEKNQVFFVDWEGAWWGHSLADIGTFLRYRQFFGHRQRKLFEQTYQSYAERKLPENWFELSLFRDLVNPLQLLSAEQDAPLRDADLVQIIEGTLAFWGY